MENDKGEGYQMWAFLINQLNKKQKMERLGGEILVVRLRSLLRYLKWRMFPVEYRKVTGPFV